MPTLPAPVYQFDVATPNNSFDDEMWVKSLGPLTIVRAIFFKLHNLAVNIFSAYLLYKKYLEKHVRIEYLWLYCAYMALCTIVNNLVSKVPDLGKSEKSLKFDEKQSYLSSLLFEGEQTTWFHNLEQAIAYHEDKDPEHKFVVVLKDDIKTTLFKKTKASTTNSLQESLLQNSADNDDSDPSTLPTKLEQAIQLLKLRFRDDNKYTVETTDEDSGKITATTHTKEIRFIAESELPAYLAEDDTWKQTSRLTLISEADLSTTTFPDAQEVRVIYFSRLKWMERIVHDYQNHSLSQALKTTGIASGVFFRYYTNIIAPSAVVLITGMHAMLGIQNLLNIDSRPIHGLFFLCNLLTSKFGKMDGNNAVKGKEAEIMTMRTYYTLHDKFYYGDPLNINWSAFSMTALISAISIVPLGITAALFYTVKGLQSSVDEFNFISGTNIELSRAFEIFVIVSALYSSLPMSIFTSSRQLYQALAARNLHFNRSGEAVERHPVLWKFSNWCSAFDSAGFGLNAFVNCLQSWSIAAEHLTLLQDIAQNAPYIEYLSSGTVALPAAVMQLFWSMYKAISKLTKCVHLSGEIIRNSPTLTAVSQFIDNTSCCPWAYGGITLFGQRHEYQTLRQVQTTVRSARYPNVPGHAETRAINSAFVM